MTSEERATKRMIEQLEACTLSTLTHEDHVRVAWYYLSQAPLPKVLHRLPVVLKKFAKSKGAPEIYHETITYAFTCAIAERLAMTETDTWGQFKIENADLLQSDFLKRYYDKKVLDSAHARKCFVLPVGKGSRCK